MPDYHCATCQAYHEIWHECPAIRLERTVAAMPLTTREAELLAENITLRKELDAYLKKEATRAKFDEESG